MKIHTLELSIIFHVKFRFYEGETTEKPSCGNNLPLI